jgi:hypothetical protein
MTTPYMAPEQKPLSERLLLGAKMLGNLWRRGKRCKTGWDVTPADVATGGGIAFLPCPCEPKTDFCKARIQWLTLAFQAELEIVIGPYALFYMMTAPQWDATGLTATVESEKAGMLRVGQKGTISMTHLAKLAQDPASAVSIFSLTRTFPKARVEGVVEPGPGEQVA